MEDQIEPRERTEFAEGHTESVALVAVISQKGVRIQSQLLACLKEPIAIYSHIFQIDSNTICHNRRFSLLKYNINGMNLIINIKKTPNCLPPSTSCLLAGILHMTRQTTVCLLSTDWGMMLGGCNSYEEERIRNSP